MLGAILAALGSAFCFALAATLQHREALCVGPSGVADVRLLWKLCHRPFWLVGVGMDLVSMGLHVFALSLGTLALVQPLGVTGIVFAIPLAAVLRKQRIRRLDVVAGVAVVLGLFGLLRSLPSSHLTNVPSVGAVLLMVLAILAIVAVPTVISHHAPGRPRALLLAAAAGTSFGLTAVLVRALLLLARRSGTAPAVVTVSIAIAVIGSAGYLLLQSAYRAGHFAASVATTMATNPLVAVVVGSILLHEKLPADAGHLISMGATALLILAGIALLVRSPAALSFAPPDPNPPRSSTRPALLNSPCAPQLGLRSSTRPVCDCSDASRRVRKRTGEAQGRAAGESTGRGECVHDQLAGILHPVAQVEAG